MSEYTFRRLITEGGGGVYGLCGLDSDQCIPRSTCPSPHVNVFINSTFMMTQRIMQDQASSKDHTKKPCTNYGLMFQNIMHLHYILSLNIYRCRQTTDLIYSSGP